MPELQNVSLSSPTPRGVNQSFATEVSNVSTLSAFLSLKGWSDLNPHLQALDEREHSQQLELESALSWYEDEPTVEHGQRLLKILMQEQARLITQKEEAQRKYGTYQAEAESTHQHTASYSLTNLWYWVSHNVQDFFGSSPEALADHYATIVQQREQQLSQLNGGIALLQQELETLKSSIPGETESILSNTNSSKDITAIKPQDDEVMAIERPQREAITASFSSPTSRHLLQQSLKLRIVREVPNQVIPIGQSYRYSLTGIFSSSNPYVLGATQTEQQSLPTWLSLQPELLSAYPSADSGGIGIQGVQSVAVSGSTVFVADGLAGLQVLDVSDPSQPPIFLGNYSSLDTQYGAHSVAVSESIVFVADYNAGLLVLDVSNTSHPTLLSTYPAVGLGGVAVDVAVSGSTVFVANYGAGLLVLDVSNTSDPIFLSNYSSGSEGTAFGVAVSGSTVFVADGLAGLQILDVSNATQPILLCTYPSADTTYGTHSVAVSESLAFVADGLAGLQILDISNTSHPILLSTYPFVDTTYGSQSVVVSGSMVFVANGVAGLQVLDVSNPSRPVLLSTYPADSGQAYGVAVSGSTIFVADGLAGLQVLNVSQGWLVGTPPLNSIAGQQIPITLMAYDLVTEEILSSSFTLTLDQFPYVPQTTVSDQSVFPGQTLSSFLSTRLFSSSAPLGLSLSLSLQGGGVKPSWLSLSPALQLLNTYLTGPGEIGYDMAISGSIVLVTYGSAGLRILNVSNPSQPILLSTYVADSGQAYGVAVSGSTVFVAYGSAGLRILDISNLSQPILLSTFPAGPGLAQGVAVLGQTVFVANYNAGLLVLNVSNITHPIFLSNYSAGPGEFADDVAVSESIVFVADGSVGLQILDVSNLSQPILLSTFPAGPQGIAQHVAMSGSTVFVANWIAGLQVLDVSNPSSPILLNISRLNSGYTMGVAVSGSTVFVANGFTGLQVLDVSNPNRPILLSSYPASTGGTNGGIVSVAVSGSTLFALNYNADLQVTGLQVLDISQQMLTAIPFSSDIGNYDLQLVATDIYGGFVAAPFRIKVEGPPQFMGRIPLQYAPIGQIFNYFIPQGLVIDPNNDPISFSARLTDSPILPAWLSFNSISATFTGNPERSNAGTFNITIGATDYIAGMNNTTFLIFVGSSIVPPAQLHNGRFFLFPISNMTFAVRGVTFEEYLFLPGDGSTPPDWLIFDVSSLQLSGIPPLNETVPYTLSLKIVASNSQNDTLTAPFNLLLVPNAPFQINPISAQTATTGERFEFFIPTTTFINPNGYAINYSATLVDEGSLPAWLHFNSEAKPYFWGTPDYSDTDFYAWRRLSVLIQASDGIINGSTFFTLNVGGTSSGQLAVMVASPIVSFLAALYSLYKLRGVVLNRCAKQRYKKGTLEGEVGKSWSYPLETPSGKISEVAVRLPVVQAKQACSRCCQFFKLPQTLSGNTLLPTWLIYDPQKRELRTKRTIPDIAGQEFIIQVCNKDKVILEEYTLKIVPKKLMNIQVQVDDESTTTTSDEKENKLRNRVPADTDYQLQDISDSHLPSITETQEARFYQRLPSQDTFRQPPTGERRCILQ